MPWSMWVYTAAALNIWAYELVPIFGPHELVPIFGPHELVPIFGPYELITTFGPYESITIFGPYFRNIFSILFLIL